MLIIKSFIESKKSAGVVAILEQPISSLELATGRKPLQFGYFIPKENESTLQEGDVLEDLKIESFYNDSPAWNEQKPSANGKFFHKRLIDTNTNVVIAVN
jgi:hypothetical protein